MLREVASRGCDAIKLDIFNELWSKIKDRATYDLDLYNSGLIEASHKLERISENIDLENPKDLDIVAFVDLLPVLTRLEREGILFCQEDESGIAFPPL